MKKVLQLYSIFLIAGLVWLGNSTGPLPGNTGAPGEFTCGRSPCHNIPSNNGSGEVLIEIDEGDNNYMAGNTHTISISLLNSATVRQGFQILALNENNQNVGSWVLTEPDLMKIISGITNTSRKYVTHTLAGSDLDSWSFDWEAPETNVGDITFYVSVLAANNNGENTGDTLYNESKTVIFSEPSAVVEPIPNDLLQVYPVPASTNLNFFNKSGASMNAQLYDYNGRLIQDLEINPGRSALPVAQLSPGVYLLYVKTKDHIYSQKIIVNPRS